MNQEKRPLITTAELMQQLSVSRNTLYLLRKKGLPYVRVGKAIRYEFQAVGEWLEKQNE